MLKLAESLAGKLIVRSIGFNWWLISLGYFSPSIAYTLRNGGKMAEVSCAMERRLRLIWYDKLIPFVMYSTD